MRKSILPLALVVLGWSFAAARAENLAPPPPPGSDLVLVANGSGDFRTTTIALTWAVRETGVPLRVQTFVWSHGKGRYALDHIDHRNHVAQGKMLANVVAAYRQAHPESGVYLVGHSAGASVVLTAAECLPPGSLAGIILLAPSVTKDYDLRPALACSTGGIDVFYSCRDVVQLGIGTGIFGTADRYWTAPAGRVGFTPIIQSPCDAALYSKLRQHPWEQCVKWTGNKGGHFGTQDLEFAKAYLLPHLLRTVQ